MNAKHIFLLAAFGTLIFCGAAQAQWQWLDDTGRKVFSDRPPPPNVPEKNVLHRPAGSGVAVKVSSRSNDPAANTPTPATPTSTAASQGTSPGKTSAGGTDAELEKKKAEQEAEQERQKVAQEQKQALLRQDNCDRARRARDVMQSGQMMAHTNAQGERGFMNDETRQQELARANQTISSDCS